MAKPQPCRLPLNVPAELERAWERAPPGRQVAVRNEALRRLRVQLDFDERRPRPPVTLPGHRQPMRPVATDSSVQAPAAKLSIAILPGPLWDYGRASRLRDDAVIWEAPAITVGTDRLLARLRRLYGEARTDIAPQLRHGCLAISKSAAGS